MIRTLAVVVLWIGLLPRQVSAEDQKSVVQSNGRTTLNISPNKNAPSPAKAPLDAQQVKANQSTWALHLGTTVEVTNSLGMKLVLIPPGEFLMGSTDEQIEAASTAAAQAKVDENTRKRIRETERPQHRVAITKPFRLGATEVTIDQFKKFVDAVGYKTEAEKFGSANSAATIKANAGEKQAFDWRWPGYDQTGDAAVSQITWNDAVAFCNWLSRQEKLQPCYALRATGERVLMTDANGYRLPTEAEWEYACRAGTTTQFSFGDDYRELEKYGWFNQKSGSTPVRSVGLKRPNPFGLHDMHGNLFEWCQDYFDPKGYAKAPLDDAVASAEKNRVMRGGDWFGNAIRCRSAFRGYGAQATRSDDVGIRLVRMSAK